MTKDAGRIAWMELNAQRVTASAEFYRALFGWDLHPLHVPPWGAMPILANGGREFANQFMAMGAFAMPRWLPWIAADLDRAPAQAKALGAPAPVRSEIPGNGRRLDGRDPAGVSYGLMEPDFALPLRDLPGEPCLAELWGADPAALAPFYAAITGLVAAPVTTGMALAPGSGGADPRLLLRQSEVEVLPPRWIPYFRTSSLGADLERARRLGAIVQIPEEAVAGVGRLAILADPGGVAFGLFEPG